MKSKLIETSLIGESIKTLRLRKNLTQEALADSIGYSVRNLRRIETNGTNSIDTINAIAEYFGISALDILNGCLLIYKNKNLQGLNTGDLHRTLITLICYSYMCTIG